MKNLIFRKEEDQTKVLFRNGTAEDPFSYVEMIKHLLEGERLGDTEFEEGITEEEQASVNAMIEEINATVNGGIDVKVESTGDETDDE